jgi:hypothetical protein
MKIGCHIEFQNGGFWGEQILKGPKNEAAYQI